MKVMTPRTFSAFLLAFVVGFALNASGWPGMARSRGPAGNPVSQMFPLTRTAAVTAEEEVDAGEADAGEADAGEADAGPDAGAPGLAFSLFATNGNGTTGVCATTRPVGYSDGGIVALSFTRDSGATCTATDGTGDGGGLAYTGIMPGDLVLVGNDVLRQEYNANDVLGALLEPDGDNYAAYNQQMDNAYWIPLGATTVTANYGDDPYGNATAERFQFAATAAGGQALVISNPFITVGCPTGSAAVYSCYVRAVSLDGGVQTGTTDICGGSLAEPINCADCDYTSESYTRCFKFFSASVAPGYLGIGNATLYNSPGTGVPGQIPRAAADLLISTCQCEGGAVGFADWPSSPIITTTTAALPTHRAADSTISAQVDGGLRAANTGCTSVTLDHQWSQNYTHSTYVYLLGVGDSTTLGSGDLPSMWTASLATLGNSVACETLGLDGGLTVTANGLYPTGVQRTTCALDGGSGIISGRTTPGAGPFTDFVSAGPPKGDFSTAADTVMIGGYNFTSVLGIPGAYVGGIVTEIEVGNTPEECTQ